MTKEEILSMAKEAGMFAHKEVQPELERFADLVAEKEREAIFDEWHSCVMSDLENGVKCLNEKAAKEWHDKYPAQSKMFPAWIEERGQK